MRTVTELLILQAHNITEFCKTNVYTASGENSVHPTALTEKVKQVFNKQGGMGFTVLEHRLL